MNRPDNDAPPNAAPDALAAAGSIASSLTDPQIAWKSTPPPGGRAWPQSLAGGAAGIALLHIEQARSGQGDWNIAHNWLSVATSGELTGAANAGLFFGAPALAFAVHAAADRPGRYERALRALDASTTTLTRRRLDHAHARIDRGDRPELAEFDLIRGLAGLGAYHLRRHPDDDITTAVVSYLVRLTEPLPGHADDLPSWWTNLAPNGAVSPDFPGGHGNLGMSHGIGSVLALLSLTLLHQLPVPGAADAVERICAWTDAWLRLEKDAAWWPGFITIDQVHAQQIESSLRPRPSWCYGIAGTARAQQLAGLATGNTARQQVAENAMLATLRHDQQLDRLDGIELCHGTAGLLQAAWRMANDSHDPQIGAELPRLAARLIAQLPKVGSDPELLDGAAGAALALHTIGTDAAASGWDTLLLLA